MSTSSVFRPCRWSPVCRPASCCAGVGARQWGLYAENPEGLLCCGALRTAEPVSVDLACEQTTT